MDPVLYLDVDGVIAPMRHRLPRNGLPHYTWEGAWHWEYVGGYHVLLNANLMNALTSLPVHIMWATTWEHTANAIGELFDWPVLPVAATERAGQWHIDWKMRCVSEHIIEHERPHIWIDDHVIADDAFARRPSWKAEGLYIAPESDIGITEEHVEDIYRFIDSL